MTDERMGDALWPAIACLPRRSGIVVRHYHLPPQDRLRLIGQVRRAAWRGRHLVVVAVPPAGARATAIHLPGFARRRPPGRPFRTASVHSVAETRRATRLKADAAFISPVFATLSHREARPLGRFGFAGLARRLGCPAIALGGLTGPRFRRLAPLGAHGFAAVSYWLEVARAQKASAPPI
ncbi:thiamine phosphate synthase [Thermaurantiacus sp.]